MATEETIRALQDAIEEQAPKCRWATDQDAMRLREILEESRLTSFFKYMR